MSTPNFRISAISLAILQAFSMGSAFAAETDSAADQPVAEVVITGARAQATRAGVGGFSDTPLLQTPASISVLTSQQMQDLNIRSTTEAMRYDTSVSDSYNAVGYSEQFSIRGFKLDNESGYRKDGMAIPGDTQIPLENKERIEVLKGLAGLQAGVAAPGGIVNYVTKRPTDAPLRTVEFGVSERGTLYSAVDLGGRFDDTRFGYRINAASERLRSYVKGADGHRNFISGAFDFKISPDALLQIDADYQKKAQVSVPGFQLINNATLPQISADNMLNNQPWSKPVETTSSNIGIRFEYNLAPQWKAVFSANQHQFKRDDYTAFPEGCGEMDPGFCSNGDYNVYDYVSLGEKKSPLTAQAMLQGEFSTGAIRHALTVGTSYFKNSEKWGDDLYTFAGTSNIYHPVVINLNDQNLANASSGPVSERRTDHERALFAQDIVSLNEQLNLHAGARYVSVKRDEYVAADVADALTDKGFWLPNLALVYKVRPNVAMYGSYAQGLEHGSVAPVGTTNQNRALEPGKSKQVELGVKADVTQDLSATVALYQIRKGLEYLDNPSNTWVRNGEATHRGLEMALNGKLTRDLLLGMSATAINTRQSGTGDAGKDGKREADVPTFKSNVYADYAVPQVAGLKLNADWQFTTKKAFDTANTVFVPGYHLLNLGGSYAMRVGSTSVTLRAQVDNALNKFYWRDVTPELGGYLLAGSSRIYRLSAQLDF